MDNINNPTRTEEFKTTQNEVNTRTSNKRLTSKKGTLIMRKKTIRDPFEFNLTHNTDNNKIEDSYLTSSLCTATTLGKEKIFQKCYICPICDPRRKQLLCWYCYVNCHEQCRELEGKDSDKVKEEFNINGIKEFACYCGIRLKHKPDKPKKKAYIACTMLQLDDALGIDLFYCENHKKTICCVCSVDCHSGCTVVKYKKKVNLDLEQDTEVEACLCEGDKHTSYNEIAFSFPLEKYKMLSGVNVWPIQILNILFSNKTTFDKLKHLFTDIIKKQNVDEETKNKFYPLLESFSNTFNRKFKTFYYHEDIIQMFNFEDLVGYIRDIEIDDPQTILLKFRLMFVLLFVHLRKDFQMVKSLTSVDFLSNSLLERLEYKKLLTQPTIFTHIIDKKYNLSNLFKEDNILKRIVMEGIFSLMEEGMDYVGIEENQDEFEIGLKYICFMLKRMIFTKGDIIKLISSIYKFHSKFVDYLNSEKHNIFSLLDIFNGLAEIFFMITIIYNDIVIEEHLAKSSPESANLDDISDFIHVKSEHGSLLFKMVVKSCDVLKKHYLLIQKEDYSTKTKKELEKEKNILNEKKRLQEIIEAKTTGVKVKLPQNGGLLCEKIIKLFNETIKMFSLADNIYFKQIKKITKFDLLEYYYYVKKIETSFYNTFDLSEGTAIIEALYNLKLGIETKLNNFFTSSYNEENMKMNQKILDSIDNFNLTIQEKVDMIEAKRKQEAKKRAEMERQKELLNKKQGRNTKKSISQKQTEKMRRMSVLINAHEEPDNKIEKKIYKNFFVKIRTLNEGHFGFLQNENFLNYKEDFVDCLIRSNIDETLGKVLIFFSNRKFPNLLTYDLLDMILSFFSLFFLTKRGMKYFLMGKNITRINKVLNRFNCKPGNKNLNEQFGKNLEENIKYTHRILFFLKIMVKGMRIFEIELKDHKVLLRYKKNLLEHIEQFNLISDKDEHSAEFKIHLTLVMKILYYLSDNFEVEDFEEIRRRIILIFHESPLNLFDPSAFTSFFSGLGDDDSNSQSEESSINNDNQNLAKNLMRKAKKENDKNKIEDLSEKEMVMSSSANNNEENKLILKENHDESSTPLTSSILGGREIENANDIIRKEGLSLYFSFFNLVSKRFYYIFNLKEEKEILNCLFKFNDLKDFKLLFETKQLTTKQKTILLRYCRQVYFIDHLDNYNILQKEKGLTTIEFKHLIESNTIVQQNIGDFLSFGNVLDLPTDLVKDLQEKYSLVNQIDIVMQIYIEEIKLFPYQLSNKEIGNSQLFFPEFLFGIKFIANYFFFEKKIWSRLTLRFFELTLEFLRKMEILKKVYNEMAEKGTINTHNTPPNENTAKILERMESTSFNIYNQRELYKYITEAIQDVLEDTKIYKNTSLSKYLERFDKIAEANFTPFSLIETLDYEYFYMEDSEKEEKEAENDIVLAQIKNIEDSFIKSFIDINNTNFLFVISSISNESIVVDYRQKIVDYFHSFLNSNEGNITSKLECLLCVIVKMLFYDGDGMQGKFECFIDDRYFFPNFNKLLNQNIVKTFALSKNVFAFETSLKVTNLTKLIIQFLQSLGEGFNTTYHDNIFKFQQEIEENSESSEYEEDEENPGDNEDDEDDDDNEDEEDNEEDISKLQPMSDRIEHKIHFNTISLTSIPNIPISKTLYESVIFNLRRIIYFLEMDTMIDCELPYDKLIILATNFIDFAIEYIETTEDKHGIIVNNFKNLFFGGKKEQSDNEDEMIDKKSILEVLFMKIKTDKKNQKLYLLRKKVISYMKMKLLQYLISYLQGGNKEDTIIRLTNSKCSPIELFSEILYNFRELLNNLERKNEKLYYGLSKISSEESYVNKLIDYYSHEKDFRDTIELPLCLKYYILIKTYEDMYSQNSLRDHFKKIVIDNTTLERDKDENWGLRSQFAKVLHSFLEKIIVKVEIKNNEEDNEEEDDNEMDYDQLVSTVVSKINAKDQEEKKDEAEEEEDDNMLIREKAAKKEQNRITFFIRPYLTFFLSEHSKKSFEENVDRTNATSKFVELVSYADYCLFEMIVNYHTIGRNKFLLWMSEIDFYYIEIINYILIIVQNVLVMNHFYRSPDLPSNEYDVVDDGAVYNLYNDNMFLALFQIVFLLIFLFIWYYFKFPNCYQKNLMKLNNRTFVFRKKGEKNKISQKIIDFFQEDDISVMSVLSDINKNVSKWEVFYTSVIESMLTNREMNILLITLILYILYFVTQSSMFLVIPTIFIANIIPTLFDIFKSIKMKFTNMITVLMFTYLVVYLFMWVTYFYMADLFVFDNVLEKSSGAEINESFCYSSLQCFLFMLNQGVRSGGGIGDVIEKVSYQSDVWFFLFRFGYDMLFFILVILVLGNVFLGIIVDTFAELRDENTMKENDKRNICFICQLSRDACLTRNIDFNKHVKNEHFIWNYVYFLTYLHVSNPNDFNRLENSVWSKLEEQDFGWIPIETGPEE